MALAPFDLVRFRELFPALDAATDQQVLLWADIAACSLVESCELAGSCYATAWQLLTAHIGQLLLAAARGATRAGVVTSAAVDKVSVGYAPPPYRSGWAYWLVQSPYGQQLQAMLSAASTGGFYLGGTVVPERSAFRGPGGFFTR